jgi:hypothetical protein
MTELPEGLTPHEIERNIINIPLRNVSRREFLVTRVGEENVNNGTYDWVLNWPKGAFDSKPQVVPPWKDGKLVINNERVWANMADDDVQMLMPPSPVEPGNDMFRFPAHFNDGFPLFDKEAVLAVVKAIAAKAKTAALGPLSNRLSDGRVEVCVSQIVGFVPITGFDWPLTRDLMANILPKHIWGGIESDYENSRVQIDAGKLVYLWQHRHFERGKRPLSAQECKMHADQIKGQNFDSCNFNFTPKSLGTRGSELDTPCGICAAPFLQQRSPSVIRRYQATEFPQRLEVLGLKPGATWSDVMGQAVGRLRFLYGQEGAESWNSDSTEGWAAMGRMTYRAVLDFFNLHFEYGTTYGGHCGLWLTEQYRKVPIVRAPASSAPAIASSMVPAKPTTPAAAGSGPP